MGKKSESEFGRGLVYNLALFMAHCGNPQADKIFNKHFIFSKPKEEQDKILVSDPDGSHNYGFNKDIVWWVDKIVPIYGSVEKALSNDITLWANGATDHLYEIEVPKEWEKLAIGKKIRTLQDKGLDMGHGFKDIIYTVDDLKELVDLTKEIARDIDKKLGVKSIKGTWE